MYVYTVINTPGTGVLVLVLVLSYTLVYTTGKL